MTAAGHPLATPSLVGHAEAERGLLDAWADGRLPHGWLISGPRGIGKMTLACRFARFVLANPEPAAGGPSLFGDAAPERPGSLAVAEDHPAFRLAAGGAHPDLRILDRRTEKGRARANILVDAVREACRAMSLTAAGSGWRVVIVDDAETMSASACNALLKLLEEPPPRGLLLLVTHAPGLLPPTIRSRCRHARLSPLPAETVAAALKDVLPGPGEAERLEIARLSDGSLGRALALAEGDGPGIRRELAALFAGLPGLDVRAAHGFADRFARRDEDADLAWQLATFLAARWLSTLARSEARGLEPSRFGYGGAEADAIVRLRRAGGLDRWLAAWDKMLRLRRDAAEVNLDRKQAMLEMLGAIASASRRGGRPRPAAAPGRAETG